MPTTNKPITFDGQNHREMTDAEYAQWQADAAAARASAIAKLAGLGLTPDEIAALVGA